MNKQLSEQKKSSHSAELLIGVCHRLRVLFSGQLVNILSVRLRRARLQHVAIWQINYRLDQIINTGKR